MTFVFQFVQAAQWAAVVEVVVGIVVVVFAIHWQGAQPHSELVQAGQAEKV